MNASQQTTEPSAEVKRVLSFMGIARAAGELLTGQDQVFAAIKKKKRIFVVLTRDCSPSVARKAENYPGAVIARINATRDELGRYLGVGGAQIAALSSGSGFLKKLRQLLQQGGSSTDEQDEGLRSGKTFGENKS